MYGDTTQYRETQNSVARRNYALTTETFDCEHMLQIKCGDEILVTVTAPMGLSIPSEFVVFNGNGLDAPAATTRAAPPASQAVKRFKVNSPGTQVAWCEAVRFGYSHALSRMMVADQREARSRMAHEEIIDLIRSAA